MTEIDSLPTSQDHDVGSSLSVGAVAALVCTVALLGTGYYFYSQAGAGGVQRISLATGGNAGTYAALGGRLAAVLEADGAFEKVEVQHTEGSQANMIALREGRADLAFVQSDTKSNGDVQLVATLYDEVLHCVVASRRDEIRSLDDLAGRPVFVGGERSGTRQVVVRMLDHLGIEIRERTDLSTGEIGAKLGSEIDAAFVLAAVPSPAVRALLDAGKGRVLPIPCAPGLERVFPFFRATTIPARCYPVEAFVTLQVTAQLVARRGVDADAVRRVTAGLFAGRARMAEAQKGGEELPIARRIREAYDPALALIPYHDGAVAYYEREEPHFFVEYAEVISLGASGLVGLVSAAVAFREWRRRRKKNRIDEYYLEVRDVSVGLPDADLTELRRARARLDEVRRRAFRDLVAERLEADSSFLIFQDFIRGELDWIDARLPVSTRS